MGDLEVPRENPRENWQALAHFGGLANVRELSQQLPLAFALQSKLLKGRGVVNNFINFVLAHFDGSARGRGGGGGGRDGRGGGRGARHYLNRVNMTERCEHIYL
jgi:hypothetical protein